MNKLKLGIISFRYACNILQDDVRTGMRKWYKYIQICLWNASSKKLRDTTYKDVKKDKEDLTFANVKQGLTDFGLMYDTIKEKIFEGQQYE